MAPVGDDSPFEPARGEEAATKGPPLNATAASQTPTRASWGLARCCAVLALAAAALFPLVAWHGHAHHGAVGLTAVAVAAGVSLAGAMAALVVTGMTRGRQYAVQGILAGMLFRWGLPLASGVVLHSVGGPLARAGVFGYILVYYLFMLVVETYLAVVVAGPRRQGV